MKLYLTQGYVVEIDDIDWSKVKDFKWYSHLNSGSRVYARTTIRGQKIYLTHLLMNPGLTLEVDHIDGNTLNCKRSNLQIVTRQENLAKRRQRGYAIYGRGEVNENVCNIEA